MKREFYVVIERDEDGFYVGEVPSLRACYSQGKTIEELLENIKESSLVYHLFRTKYRDFSLRVL